MTKRLPLAAALAGALSFPLIAQQQPCPPQSKAQKAAAWLNRARNPTAPAPANTGCPAATASAPAIPAPPQGGYADGAVITTFSSANVVFLQGGRGSGINGRIMDSGRLIEWQWRSDPNDATPTVLMNLGALPSAANHEQVGGGVHFEGMKGGKWYFSNFSTAGGVIYVSVTRNQALYTITCVKELPHGLTDIDGNPLETPEPPAPKPSYVFQPYTKELEEALYKAEQTQAGAGLPPGYHGGILTITGPNGPVNVQLQRPPKAATNFWIEVHDPNKAFIIDGGIVNPVLRQPDGAWVKEDGTPVRAFGALAEPK